MSEYLFETPYQVKQLLDRIQRHNAKTRQYAQIPSEDLMTEVRTKLDRARFNILAPHAEAFPTKWHEFFIEVGASCLDILGEIKVLAFTELLLSKHQRYGAGPIVSWREVGITMRMDSKFSRYENMVENDLADSDDESKEDTLLDIVGYCILGLALQEYEL